MNRVILDPVSKRFMDTGEDKQRFILCPACGQPKPRRNPAYNKKYPLCYKCGQETSRILSKGNQWSKLRHYPEVVLSEDQEQIIIGSTLGDGGLYLGGNSIHYRFQVSHSEKDSKYLYWKYNHLPSKLFRKPPFRRAQSLTPNSGVVDKSKGYPDLIYLRTIQHPILDQYHALLYSNNGKKAITIKVLNSIKPLGLAIWYQDDGTLYFPPHYKTPSVSLAVYSFGLKGAKLIQEWLWDKFKIETQDVKPNKLHIRVLAGSFNKFIEIVEPFIILERKSGMYHSNYNYWKFEEVGKQVVLDPITKKFIQVGNNVKDRN